MLNLNGGIGTTIIRHTKHVAYRTLFASTQFLNKHGVKLGVVALVLFILFKKDVSIHLQLSNKKSPAVTETSLVTDTTATAVPVSYETTTAVERTIETAPEKVDINRKRYNNLAFILNPGYAKRHNIDPRIVADHNNTVKAYVKKYAPIAIAEQKKYGIPASITLAQGLWESNAGESRLALENKNHFGIKCFSKTCEKGHCSNHTDDSHKDFFRNYVSNWESYRDHSQFLQKDRYKDLYKLDATDYKGWAHGLKKAGYATDKRYAYKLIAIIEALNLDKYDEEFLN